MVGWAMVGWALGVCHPGGGSLEQGVPEWDGPYRRNSMLPPVPLLPGHASIVDREKESDRETVADTFPCPFPHCRFPVTGSPTRSGDDFVGGWWGERGRISVASDLK